MREGIEIIGILASLVVLGSFTLKDINKIRVVNIVGSALFVTYGILISSFSTYFLNSLLIIVHIVYLVINIKKKKAEKLAKE